MGSSTRKGFKWIGDYGKLAVQVGGKDVAYFGTGGTKATGHWDNFLSADTSFALGNRVTPGDTTTPRRTRVFHINASDGGLDPTMRIESSCHSFVQTVDWPTGWSATALEGVFYGGYDLVATDDNANISAVGGWIYLNDESGNTGAGTSNVVGGSSGCKVYVCGLESWVAMSATTVVNATGYICGLKLSNNFVTGATTTGLLAAIYCECVDSIGYDVVYGSNIMGNGFVAATSAMTTNATFAAMIVDIAGQKGYIPVFFDAEWTAS
jgi:hypothetical protein